MSGISFRCSTAAYYKSPYKAIYEVQTVKSASSRDFSADLTFVLSMSTNTHIQLLIKCSKIIANLTSSSHTSTPTDAYGNITENIITT